MQNVIGIDIGGTKIQGVVYDGKKIAKELTIVTPGNLDSFKRGVLKLIDFLSAEYNISGVGIGMAGLMDPKKGIAIASPNIRYIKNFPLVYLVKSHGYKNVFLDNDANCFLRAESAIGKARPFKHSFGLIVGTGVGGAMMLDGRLYRGSENSGGELGGWLVDGLPLEKLYKKFKQEKDFKSLARIFGIAFSDIIYLLAPECIIVGGTYGQLYHKKFLGPALQLAKKNVFNKVNMPKLIISNTKAAGALAPRFLPSSIYSQLAHYDTRKYHSGKNI